jgi:DNA-binding transcriptional LysR family regulator
MFDFRLKVFHTVAKRLNFTRAAEELYITQPAVTKHIHEIESHFKVRLFERNGTKIKLTPAGEILLQHTEQLFTVYRNLEFDLNSLSQRHSGKLHIGASTTVAQYVLPPMLAAFRRKFRDIQVAMTIDNTDETGQSLVGGSIDLGIIEGHSKNNLFKYTEFVKDELILVADPRHPLARKAAINPGELLKIPLLLREPGSGTLEVIAHALKPLNIKISQLRLEMQMGSSEGMKGYIPHSDSMAFLSVHAVHKELKNKELVRIDVKGLSIHRNFYFIQLQGQTEGLPDLFMRFARNAASDWK